MSNKPETDFHSLADGTRLPDLSREWRSADGDEDEADILDDGPPVVRIKRTRCPACKSTRLNTYHSRKYFDGSLVVRYARCLSCECHFKVIVE